MAPAAGARLKDTSHKQVDSRLIPLSRQLGRVRRVHMHFSPVAEPKADCGLLSP